MDFGDGTRMHDYRPHRGFSRRFGAPGVHTARAHCEARGQPIAAKRKAVGIAVGMLLTALHLAGLAALPYTPHPMGFLNDILQRPANERPFVLLVVGHPADDARVPAIARKPLEEIASFL